MFATDLDAARQEYGCPQLICDDDFFPEAPRPDGAEFPLFSWARPAAAGAPASASAGTQPGPGMGEVEATPYFAEHLQSCLEKCGVKFGRGGFKMMAVHRRSIFSLRVANRVINGGTDVAIVPWNAHPLEAARHVRFLGELKVPLSEDKLPDTVVTDPAFVRKVEVELLAAQLASPHPVLALLTDGVAGNMLLRVVQEAIATSQQLTWNEVIPRIAGFLIASSADALDGDLAALSKKRKERGDQPPCDDACAAQVQRMRKTAAERRPPALIEEQLASLDALEESEEGRREVNYL